MLCNQFFTTGVLHPQRPISPTQLLVCLFCCRSGQIKSFDTLINIKLKAMWMLKVSFVAPATFLTNAHAQTIIFTQLFASKLTNQNY